MTFRLANVARANSVTTYLRQMIAWVGLGITIALIAAVVAGGLLTLESLYRGERSMSSGVKTAGVARVNTCEHVGPLTRYGFGFWWECDATVSLADGRRIDVALGGSIVTPRDRGRDVAVVETCFDDEGACSYTRAGSWFLGTSVHLLQLARRLAAIVGVFAATVCFLRGVLGWRLYSRVTRRRSKKHQELLVSEQDVVESECGYVETSPGQGILRVTFHNPSTAVRTLHGSSLPRLSIDGKEVDIGEWGTRSFSLDSGRHHVKAWSLLGGSEVFGRSDRRVTVSEGAEAVLLYRAPEMPYGPGTLSVNEECDLPEYHVSMLRVTIAVAVFLVLAYFVYAVARATI